jgi:hypothetical protein
LENNLHISSRCLKLMPIVRKNILIFKKDSTLGGIFEAQNASPKGGFTTAGFSYQAEGLTLFYRYINSRHGFQKYGFTT